MKPMRVVAVLCLSLSLVVTGCHSSRQSSRRTKVEEYDRPGVRGVEPNTGKRLVDEARRWLGVKYRYGGESRKGTDCSGMTMQVYQKVTGIKLPRDSRSQQSFTKRIRQSDLTPGDLVFFATKTGGDRVGHVGIYIGGGEFVHASSSQGVIISRLDEKYYVNHYHSAGRVPGLREAKSKPDKSAVTPPERETLPIFEPPADTVAITLDRFVELSAPDDTIATIVKNAF